MSKLTDRIAKEKTDWPQTWKHLTCLTLGEIDRMLEQLVLLSGLADAHISDAMVHAGTCPIFSALDGECDCDVAKAYRFIDDAIAEAKRVGQCAAAKINETKNE